MPVGNSCVIRARWRYESNSPAVSQCRVLRGIQRGLEAVFPLAQQVVGETQPAFEWSFPQFNRQLNRDILNLGRRGAGGVGLVRFIH